MRTSLQLCRLTICLSLVSLCSCAALPGGQVVDTALVVHTEGSAQHTVAAKVPANASTVFDTFVQIIERESDIDIVNRKDKAMLLEVSRDGQRVTGQATQLGAGQSLLYIWADAGDSGRSGRELATSAIEAICKELGVAYQPVEY